MTIISIVGIVGFLVSIIVIVRNPKRYTTLTPEQEKNFELLKYDSNTDTYKK